MPINWATVPWMTVALLSGVVFVVSFVGQMVAGRSAIVGAIFATILFVAIYVFWNHYPHGLMPTIRLPA